MIKYILSLILLQSSLAFGQADIKLSKEEFVQRLERNEISMSKVPYMPVPENIKKEFFKKLKTKYPNFKEEFWFVNELRTNKYIYTIYYEYYTLGSNKCVFRAEGFDRNTKLYVPTEIDVKGQPIDVKHCEKLYGIKIY